MSYAELKKHREMALEQSILELEILADNYKHISHFLSNESFKLGLAFAIRKIEETEFLFTKAHKELPYSNPKEAEREHKNQMNTLSNLKYTLAKRFRNEP